MYVRPFPAAGRVTLVTGAIAATLLAVLLFASAARAEFGVVPGSFKTELSTTQAGAPVDLTTSFSMKTEDNGSGEQVSGTLNQVTVDLPPGLIGDTTAVPTCKEAQFVSASCPAESQVGVITPSLFFGPGFAMDLPSALFNMEPGKGETARFAANMIAMVHLEISVRDDGGIRTEVHNLFDLFGVKSTKVALWGIPSDPSHDTQRTTCLQFGTCPVPSTAPRRAFLRNGTECGPQPDSHLAVAAWRSEDGTDAVTASLPDITGCDQLPPAKADVSFSPERADASAPSGLGITLDAPRVDDADAPWTPPLKSVSLTLPEGMAISPGSADGLGACSDAQLHQHDRAAVECPDASKIGTVKITTPLLADPMTGAMYLGTPRPGDQFRLFLVAEGSGVQIRLRGSAVPDPQTGRLVTTFEGLPPLPFNKLEVNLKGGPRAVLANPTSCGAAGGGVTVTPFGGGAAATSTTSLNVAGGCAAPGFSPSLVAGTTVPIAGADSPFVLQIRRDDGEHDLKSISVDLPAGLIGKVAGVPLCPTAAAIAGTCSDASKVGSVTTTVGTGSNPISLPGSVYLTEGYGGPFGLAFVVPAKIGPFDFGNVVVRAKVQVDQMTGALHIETDPMPQIIAGIPLHYRSITVNLDRDGFMRNPTSCAEQKIAASLSSTGGAVVTRSTRFAVAGCRTLLLAPNVKMTFNGLKERKRNGRPGFSFQLSQTAGQSNLRAVAVTLPGDVGLSLGLPTPCTLAEFNARACPAASKLGDSSVTTPLLDGVLQGGVYLVEADKGAGLPRLGVLLNGQVPISLLSKVVLAKKHVTTTFAAPDLPISTFKLTLNTRTALTAAKDLCASKQKVSLAILGASGARKRSTVTVPVQGCSAGKVKRLARRH